MNDKFAVSNVREEAQASGEAVAARLAELDKATEVQLEKLDIKDGDVYMVRLTGDEFDATTLTHFKAALKGKFPKVEFIVIALPPEHKAEFHKLAKG